MGIHFGMQRVSEVTFRREIPDISATEFSKAFHHGGPAWYEKHTIT
jgi:hypothetical protein